MCLTPSDRLPGVAYGVHFKLEYNSMKICLKFQNRSRGDIQRDDKTLFAGRNPAFLLNSSNESSECPGFLKKPRSFQLQIGQILSVNTAPKETSEADFLV